MSKNKPFDVRISRLTTKEKIIVKSLLSPRYKYITIYGIQEYTKLDIDEIYGLLNKLIINGIVGVFEKRNGEKIYCFISKE